MKLKSHHDGGMPARRLGDFERHGGWEPAMERPGGLRTRERGSAVVVVLALLLLMLSFVAASHHSLRQLKSELRLLERRQQQRSLSDRTAATTNSPAVSREAVQPATEQPPG